MSEPKLVFTKNVPRKVGYYWYTNFGEHTPVVLEVTKDYSSGKLFAQNEEFCFEIRSQREEQAEMDFDEDDDWREKDGDVEYRYGDQLWCYIPNPWLPSGTKQVEPDCY